MLHAEWDKAQVAEPLSAKAAPFASSMTVLVNHVGDAVGELNGDATAELVNVRGERAGDVCR